MQTLVVSFDAESSRGRYLRSQLPFSLALLLGFKAFAESDPLPLRGTRTTLDPGDRVAWRIAFSSAHQHY
jgi:hypothetical protein